MSQWNPVVTTVLEKCSGRVLPLTQSPDADAATAAMLEQHSPESLFPNARNAEAAYSALLLLLGCWEKSHDLTNDDETPEGCYLHAIIHRMEPNPANSAYWFRQLGEHHLFPDVRASAEQILKENRIPGWQLKPGWDPFLFNQWCDEARRSPNSTKEKAAVSIQRAEWELLFPWCAAVTNT